MRIIYISAKEVLFRALEPVGAVASLTWLMGVFELVSRGRRQERSIFFVSSLF